MTKIIKNNKANQEHGVNRLLDWKRAICVALVFALFIGGTLFTRHIQAQSLEHRCFSSQAKEMPVILLNQRGKLGACERKLVN